jgi:hypothetical protein
MQGHLSVFPSSLIALMAPGGKRSVAAGQHEQSVLFPSPCPKLPGPDAPGGHGSATGKHPQQGVPTIINTRIFLSVTILSETKQ